MQKTLTFSATQRTIARLVLVCFLSLQLPLNTVAYAADDREDNERIEATSAGRAAETAPDIVLAPGFLLQLSSSQDQNLNGTFRIHPDGKVDLPYNTTVKAGGMTLGDFRNELLNVYKPYFKRKPSLSASVRQRRYYVEVRGLVAQPGTYLIKKETLLDEVIAQAGGVAKPSKGSDETVTNVYVRIDQKDSTFWVDLGEYYKSGLQKEIPPWLGGDRLFVQREKPEGATNVLGQDTVKKVNVMGEVRNPGEVTYSKEGDAYYYLTKTGGPTSMSDLERVALVRKDESGERKPVQFGRVDEIKGIKEADLILFYPARPTGLERTLQTTSVIVGIITASLLTYIAVRGVNK